MHPFTKRLLVLIAIGVAGSCSIWALASVAQYKPYGVPDLLREEWESKQAAVRALQSSRQSAAGNAMAATPQATPVAVIEETEHDFGMLDAGTSAQHTFVIRNEGDAPLAISAAGTSCKCTLSKTSAEIIAPGSSADVTLTWNTGTSRKSYRQYAVVRTNDPHRREIELAVCGQIQTLLGFSTEEMAAPAVSPGSGAEAETVVFSQTLDDFEIVQAYSELPGFQFRVEPVSDEVLQSLGAKSAWRLGISTDASLGTGTFVDAVRIVVQSEQLSESNSPLTREILFRGCVLAPITFYGAGLHSEEGLDLGIMNAGTEVVSQIVVRVRGNHLPTRMEVGRVEPDILRTVITPIKSRPGVFRLTVTVPADAPQTFFNTEQKHGFVEVRDPENQSTRNWFPVHGAVVAL